MLEEGVKDLEQRKQALEVAIEQLERRRERIRQEMRSNFAGVSQELTVGFRDLKTIWWAVYRIWQAPTVGIIPF
jgi:vacuolar-type H+-ATPase subunit D/Vma8